MIYLQWRIISTSAYKWQLKSNCLLFVWFSTELYFQAAKWQIPTNDLQLSQTPFCLHRAKLLPSPWESMVERSMGENYEAISREPPQSLVFRQMQCAMWWGNFRRIRHTRWERLLLMPSELRLNAMVTGGGLFGFFHPRGFYLKSSSREIIALKIPCGTLRAIKPLRVSAPGRTNFQSIIKHPRVASTPGNSPDAPHQQTLLVKNKIPNSLTANKRYLTKQTGGIL